MYSFRPVLSERKRSQPELGDVKIQDDVTHEPSISLLVFGPLLMERPLSYKFTRTNHLGKAFTILFYEKERILIFTDWKTFPRTSSSQIPGYAEEEISHFELLSRRTRSAEDRINGQGGDVRYIIAYELLLAYSFLF